MSDGLPTKERTPSRWPPNSRTRRGHGSVSSMNISRSERSWAPIFEGTRRNDASLPHAHVERCRSCTAAERGRSTPGPQGARPRTQVPGDGLGRILSMPTRPPLTNGKHVTAYPKRRTSIVTERVSSMLGLLAPRRHLGPQIQKPPQEVAVPTCAGQVLCYIHSSFWNSGRTRRRALWEVAIMAKVCDICGKHAVAGRAISHSHRTVNRTFKPNSSTSASSSTARARSMNVCSRCLKKGNLVRG